MCAPDPNAGARMQAKIRHQEKAAKYGSDSLKYWNRETSYVRGKHRNVIGLSRTKSDAMSKALFTLGKGRQQLEAYQREYHAKAGARAFKDSSGTGYSKTADRSAYLALLKKQSDIEYTIDNTFGRKMDTVKQGIKRQYLSQEAANRQALGVRPEYGAPVMMPPKDRAGQLFANLQMGLSIASLAMTPIAPTSLLGRM